MASFEQPRIALLSLFVLSLISCMSCLDIYYEWIVTAETTDVYSTANNLTVIKINRMFPGPLINATTNDVVHVNVFNSLDEPLLFTWNGIQQRLNSWQDGVSGTNCPIEPGTNWTYVFQAKDQIGSYTYFPSINFQKSSGGYGPIRVNNRNVILVPFPKPEAEFDLLVGDWMDDYYKNTRITLQENSNRTYPNVMLMNGKGRYGSLDSTLYESFNVTKGKAYRFRISNVGTQFSFNLRFQKHRMVLVETEGSYTNQIALDSLDVHVGQSYSVLVTADQDEADYYVVATPKFYEFDPSNSSLVARGILHYLNSSSPVQGPAPDGPGAFDVDFSMNQAKSIRWNLTAGAARPNPQGTFNVSNVTLSQTFLLHGSRALIDGVQSYVVNNVSYLTPTTPLKLADYFRNGSGVYQLDEFPTRSVSGAAAYGVSVVTGVHKEWLEIVFKNDLDDEIDSWHLDGFGFFVVGFGLGEWTVDSRDTYNLYDPVVRSTVQVYPSGWTAVYVFLDNPGMWNLRSQNLVHWYMGQEIYIRVHNDDPNPAKERPPPQNLLLCGVVDDDAAFAPAPAPQAGW
ncbi:monocopper oxidase-like protein SKS1 [Salvia divinorum]|uniref:Monocopper oxidase-like protein SKS1 n=1 Tax=Salvia divinorum TaxID=28513 RepID=A0ABD1FJX7_SALDI